MTKTQSGSTKRQIQKQKRGNDSAETLSVQGNHRDIIAKKRTLTINTRNCQPLTKTKFLTNKMLLMKEVGTSDLLAHCDAHILTI